MSRLYPTSVAEVDPWRRDNGTTLDEARKRFVQFVVLECFGGVADTRDVLNFKGGNALRFVYGSLRSTLDLDFTASPGLPDDDDEIHGRVSGAIRSATQRFGVKLKCQKVKRNPKQREATLPTYQITVGYQFPGERLYPDFETSSRTAMTVVDVEISLNDVVCETEERALITGGARLRVCTLEDIVAEKLRALLQQKTRNRHRPQDVFDIASVMRGHGAGLDRGKIADYLTRKSRVRDLFPSQRSFSDEEIRARAMTGYEDLRQAMRGEVIPFDEAWDDVLELVRSLSIPEEEAPPSPA